MTVLTRQPNRDKYWATGLLLFSMVLFVVSKLLENQHPIWPWVLAFSEASMVGALADWFAVTALFRHPLKIPIPHTAIIPKSQKRIAKTLSRFVQENFLDPASLAPKLHTAQIAEHLTDWLITPNIAKTVALQLKDFISGMLDSFSYKETSWLIARAIPAISKEIKIAPLLAEFLSSVEESDQDGKLFDELLKLSEKLLTKHNEIIGSLISKELPWYIPQILKNHLYRQISEALRKTITAMIEDKDHLLRKQLSHLSKNAILKLKTSAEWEERLQAMIDSACQREVLLDYISNIQASLLAKLKQDQSGVIAESLAKIIIVLAKSVKENPQLLAKINQAASLGILRVVRDYGPKARSFIEDTMSSWDPQVLSQKIEDEVGRDLQFIRINGTLVGGLVGLLLHATILLIEKL